MTKKQALIKYISEMNTDMLSLLLDDDKSYMDVPKETFLAGLEDVFKTLKKQEINKFSRVIKGHCDGDCNPGCGGFSFLTRDNQSLDLLIEDKNEEIKDLYYCSDFINDEKIDNKNKIDLKFYEDEKTGYSHSECFLKLQEQIDKYFYEFSQYKNNVTYIDDFCEWNLNCEELYKILHTYELVNFKFIKPFQELVHKNSNIQKLIKYHPLAKKAMDDFNKINIENEGELIEWTLNYYDNELSYGIPEKVENWERNNLILHPLDNSIVINCTKYAESLQFSEVQPKYYWELFEKYRITDEQFNKAKAKNKNLKYNLETFLNIHGVHQQLSFFKISKKPVYVECNFGNPTNCLPFVILAGRELGINIAIEYLGPEQTFIDDNGVVQLEFPPELIEFELENKKATKFYNEKIGMDWRLKLQNKLDEIFLKYSSVYLPF